MSRGTGTINRNNKIEPGTPATVTGAQNGLNLVGTDVELGGILLHDTLINVDSFGFSITEGIQPLFIIENTTGDITLGEFTVGTKTNLELLKGGTATIRSAGQTLLLLDGANTTSQMGDISGLGNGLQVKVNDIGETIEIGDPDAITNETVLRLENTGKLGFESNSNDFLIIDFPNGNYLFGDINGAGNGMQVNVNDNSQLIEIGDPDGVGNETVLNVNDLQQQVTIESGTSEYFRIDVLNSQYFFGDIAGAGNQTSFLIYDAIEVAQISSGGFSRLFLDSVNGIYQLGPSGSGTPAYFEIDEVNGRFQTVYGTGSNGLFLDAVNLDYIMGDLSVVGNGGRVFLSDSLNTLFLQNASNTLGIDINGVAGFTGTVTPVTTITVNNGIVTNVA